MEKISVEELKKKADQIRILSLEMIDTAGGGHIGGSMSAMDIMTALYFRVLNTDPGQPEKEDRDWFILSAGHKAAGYIPVLAERGFLEKSTLSTFNKLNSPYGIHPDASKIAGCEASTGSLGHGLPMSIGIALALKADRMNSKVFCLMGDGEMHEGTVWEAAMSATQHKLDNITAVVDYNKCCMDGPIDEIISLEPFEEKWKSFGWEVLIIDGNDMAEVVPALEAAPAKKGVPRVIIAHTIKGKGVEEIEGDYHWHYGLLNQDVLENARKKLGGK